jgi:hypothetical protein
MVQSALAAGEHLEDVRELALRHFDAAFNEVMLETLLEYDEREAEREKFARRCAFFRQRAAERSSR